MFTETILSLLDFTPDWLLFGIINFINPNFLLHVFGLTRVVYLDFWASWCGPYRQSFSFMNDLNTKLQNKGFAVVSINVDKAPKMAAKFLDALPGNFNVIYNQNGDIAKAYEQKAMPTRYLFDRNGKLIGSRLWFKK